MASRGKWIRTKPHCMKGKKHSLQSRINMSNAHLGNKLSEETKRKMGLAHKGTPRFSCRGALNPAKRPEIRRLLSLLKGGNGIPYDYSEYGVAFDNVLKEQIRFRDKYKCQICGCSQLENGRQLDVHHKDYDKRNNTLMNLVALCRSCHSGTNSNRDYWENYFKEKTYATQRT